MSFVDLEHVGMDEGVRLSVILTPDGRPMPQPRFDRNLIMVNQPGSQAIEDWYTIAGHVREIDPTIEVFVVNATLSSRTTQRQAAKRPTFVFSPGPLFEFRPARGRVYHGRKIPKEEQVRILDAAGVRVPRTAVLTPELILDPTDWGEFVIVKPTSISGSSYGTGIQLIRTQRVRFVPPEDYPEGHPGRLGPMVVQQFVDTGKRVSVYRVLTLFGEPLSCNHMVSTDHRVDLGASDEEIERSTIATQGTTERETNFVKDADVLAFARAMHMAVPDVPLKGCDILREEGTGLLYGIEMNPGGNTWHFSSNFLAARRAMRGPKHQQERIEQFDVFRTSARVLVDRTNAEAE
jgi:hypothetical protein